MTDTVDDFLIHYGVKGMRWGFRKEYKLSPREKAVLKAEGDNPAHSKSMQAKYGKGSLSGESDKKGLSSTQKKILIGAGVGVVAVGAAFTAAYLLKKGSLPSTIENPNVGGDKFTQFMKDHEKTSLSRMFDGLSKKDVDALSTESLTLEPGAIFKRISTQKENSIRADGFYASFKDEDVNRYKAVLPT